MDMSLMRGFMFVACTSGGLMGASRCGGRECSCRRATYNVRVQLRVQLYYYTVSPTNSSHTQSSAAIQPVLPAGA